MWVEDLFLTKMTNNESLYSAFTSNDSYICTKPFNGIRLSSINSDACELETLTRAMTVVTGLDLQHRVFVL